MEKRLIIFHSDRHSAELSAANNNLLSYNKLLTDLKPLLDKLNIQASSELIINLLKNPKEYAFDHLIAGNPITLGGVPVNKQKAIEMINIPNDWENVIEIANSFNKEMAEKKKINAFSYGQTQHPNVGVDVFDMEDGLFILKPGYLADVKAKHSVYTENQKQNEVLETVLQIHDGFKKLKEMKVLGVPSLANIGIQIQEGLTEIRVYYNPEALLSGIK